MTLELLFARRSSKSSLAKDVAQIDLASCCQAYHSLKEEAPKRPTGRPYLGGRSGYPTTEGKTNRREEHFAIAMVNAQKSWILPDGTRFELLDLQVPLKATRADREIGRIDMFGLTEHGRAVLINLKVIGHSGGPSDPPPVALLEGLRYAAIVEANLPRIAKEIRDTFGRQMVLERPDIVELGEADWWSRWLTADRTFKSVFQEKSQEISNALDLCVIFASLPNAKVQNGQRSKAPSLIGQSQIEYQNSLPKKALQKSSEMGAEPKKHEALLQGA